MNQTPTELDDLMKALEAWVLAMLGTTPMIDGHYKTDRHIKQARAELVSQLLRLKGKS